jgi:signal peptidase I
MTRSLGPNPRCVLWGIYPIDVVFWYRSPKAHCSGAGISRWRLVAPGLQLGPCLTGMDIPEHRGSGTATFRVTSWWGRVLIGRNPSVTVMRLALLVVISLVAFKLVLVPVQVTGHSMEPSYRNGRINFMHRLAYRVHDPQRGDVVGIQFEGSRLILLKRVVALPGERVAVRKGRVYVNGAPLDEPYARGTDIPPTRGEVLLESDQYFAIGDNRDDSAYGLVRRSEIQGRVLF